MNRTQFTTFLKSPSALTAESSRLLSEVVKEFPYCQTAQLLYVKSLHLQNSIHYNNQLKIAAAYATDRSVLHKLITSKAGRDEPEKLMSRNDEQIVVSLKQAETPVVQMPPRQEEPSPQQILEVRLKELEELNRKAEADLKQKAEKLAEAIAEIIPEPPVEVKAEPQAESKNDSLPARKQFPIPDPDNRVEPVHTDDTQKTVRDLETLSDTYISTAIDASIQIEIEKEEPFLPVSEESGEEPESDETEPSELSFTEWLMRSKQKTGEKAPEKEPKEEEKRHKETELIEKFIKEEPRITKPKKEFYSPVNMARQSVVEDLDFVTETLAGIYAKQGNTAKAIRAYQTLSLKYPEKKLYFASLIEKLEQGT
ncbi:MAG TPA: hypothetical protein VGO45_11705 [Bacteroidia bacterium]|jgi:hypothetical protein|nr:hypothetical protein [Bacteroidia bacterium]